MTQVLDLDLDGVSEVTTSRTESGDGSAYGHRPAVQFNGWNTLLLHQSAFDSNEGVRGTRSHHYRAKEPDWQFHDLDGNGIFDLLETITHKLGRNQRQPLISTARPAFAFQHVHLMRLSESRVVPSTTPAAQ